jgi:precorrin-6A/cobalt-precorrin-6A reductase
MIILLGETPAAAEIRKHLQNKGIKFIGISAPAEKENLQEASVILDASHPSSVESVSLSQFCERWGIPYLRLGRPETQIPDSPSIFPAYSLEEALLLLQDRIAAMLRKKKHLVTVFVTTGSYQLENIIRSAGDKARFIVRVLPEGRLVQKCQDMGIEPRDIVAMQGPFSKDINKALFKFYGANILLTRDSGLAGGTDTKISAALELGLEILVIRKNKANYGFTMNHVQEMFKWIDDHIALFI